MRVLVGEGGTGVFMPYIKLTLVTGRAVADHNPGPEGEEINRLCDNAKQYLAQRTWIIKNPDVSKYWSLIG